MRLNQAGRRKAKSMIESSQYVLDSSWTNAAQNDYADIEQAADALLSLLDEQTG